MSKQRESEEQVFSAVRELARSFNSGHKIVADLSGLVAATSHLSLSNLERWERLIRYWLPQELEKSKPAAWKFWLNPSPFLTWIDLCNSDGFKRERTLRILTGGAPNRFFLAMAVRRLNDWVPQVRAAACDRLPAIAKDSNPEDVVDVLCTILPHWNSWGRMDANCKQALLKILAIEPVAHSLKLRLLSAAAGPLVSVLAQAAQTSILDEHLPEIARGAIQPSVRTTAYKFLLDGEAIWTTGRKWEWTDVRYCKGHYKTMLDGRPLTIQNPIEKTLSAASLDRSAMVRRMAGDVLIRDTETLGPSALELATKLASDSISSVAERGEFALKKLSKTAM